jgi:hypothetical protein
VEIKTDDKNRIFLVTNDRDEFGESYKTELAISIKDAIELKQQLSTAIDKAVKAGFGFDV